MLSYTIRHNPKAKHIRITVSTQGEVFVTKPARASLEMIEKFVATKEEWIKKSVEAMKSRPRLAPVVKHSKKEIHAFKILAKKIAEDKVTFFNQHYKFSYNSISIKNQKTRWGSCSKKGNLNFNYRIALLPEALADYLVVHEVCHLGQFNHSQKFWDLVGEVLPDYKKLRKQLKEISM